MKQKGLAKGIAPKYYGPFEILKRIGVNYVIKRIDVVRKKIQMVHQILTHDISTNSYSSSDTENSCITNSNDKVNEWFNMKTGNFEPIRKIKRQIKKPIRYNYN